MPADARLDFAVADCKIPFLLLSLYIFVIQPSFGGRLDISPRDLYSLVLFQVSFPFLLRVPMCAVACNSSVSSPIHVVFKSVCREGKRLV
jgi:hypothetical protein